MVMTSAGTKTVYVAEDDPAQRKLLQIWLEGRHDLKPTFFTDGLDLYHQVHETPPDCLILDIILPSMSGLEITRLLKFHDDYRKIPVIVISSITEGDIQSRALSAGADVFISKPFNDAQLLEALDKLV